MQPAGAAVSRRTRRGRSASRRRALLDAAQRLIRSRGPDVSIEQIAAEAGVSRPIVYRHFGDRQGMAEAIAEDAISRAMAAAGSPPASDRESLFDRDRGVPAWGDAGSVRGTIEALTRGHLDFVLADPAIYRFIIRERAFRRAGPAEDPAAGPLAIFVLPLTRALISAGLDASRAQLEATAVAGMLAATVTAAVAHGALDRDQLEPDLVELAMRICSTPDGGATATAPDQPKAKGNP